MAAELKSTLGFEPELIRSGGGKFEVYADERLVFSKRATGRFPKPNEVIDVLKQVG